MVEVEMWRERREKEGVLTKSIYDKLNLNGNTDVQKNDSRVYTASGSWPGLI